MLLSLNWIKEFTKIDESLSAQELGSIISLRIAEVESVKVVGEALQKVRTVKVEKIAPHPNADKLKLATINTGTAIKTIVCGASNCRAGIYVAFADLGTELELLNKDGSITQIIIKKIKIRGIESVGMLCSESELGLTTESVGIMELDEVPLGVKLSDLPQFNHIGDILFEIDNKSLTHRPDLWGHYGFAREFQVLFADAKLKPYSFYKNLKIGQSLISISNEAEQCRRYSALQINNIKVEASPQWLSSRLTSLGVNSINNIVDITNYILLELGQPMHSFDADKLSNFEMKIRYANDGENFKALNDNDYKLIADDIVIDAGGEVVALAGIMGGALSNIDKHSTNIILESANLDAASVRRSSIYHNLRSDSSSRFEKSLDPNQTIIAIERAVELILRVCPQAEVIGHIADKFTSPYPPIAISTSYDFIRQRLGVNLDGDFITKTLTSLGFTLTGDLEIAVPTWRSTKDINIKEDIVEEVGRIYGYDNICAEPLSFELEVPKINKALQKQNILKISLTQGYGFDEILCYPWLGEKQLNFYELDSNSLMTFKNPLNEDATYMRSHSEPHFINNITENLKNFAEFKLFEIGRIYDTTQMQGVLPTEKFVLTAAIVPKFMDNSLQEDSFYEAKSTAIDLLQLAGVSNYQVTPLKSEESWVHPNISLGIFRGKQKLAQVYKLHPAIAQKLSIKHNVYIFSIYLDELTKVERKFSYNLISKYPTVPFDITVVANQQELVQNISQIIIKSVKKNLIDIEIFSIYQGKNLGVNQKAVSFRLKFGAQNHTLSSEEVTKLQETVMQQLSTYGYIIK